MSASLPSYLAAIAAIKSAQAAVDDTVRHAITLDEKEAARFLALFKRMLLKNLAALEI